MLCFWHDYRCHHFGYCYACDFFLVSTIVFVMVIVMIMDLGLTNQTYYGLGHLIP